LSITETATFIFMGAFLGMVGHVILRPKIRPSQGTVRVIAPSGQTSWQQ
jgi:hypothetical protein